MQVLNEDEKNKITYVGIGEITVGYEGDILKISSLGSCIGLVLFPKDSDFSKKIAIMGHVMLANAPKKNEKKIKNRWGPAKYADEAVPTMIGKLEKLGFHVSTINAKIVGGANMFGHGSKTLKIGQTNEKMIKRLLSQNKIPICKSFTGGDVGMSVKYIVKDHLLIVQPTGGQPIFL